MIFMIKILMLINILIMISDMSHINQLLAHPNALSRALDGPGVARPRTQPQKRHARVLSTCRDASRDPFALKRCVLEHMLHLKTLGRATNLSSTKILHMERHTGREWRIHPHMHRNTPHAYFGPAQTPPWTPLHSESAHNIRHLREHAHLLDERATSCS